MYAIFNLKFTDIICYVFANINAFCKSTANIAEMSSNKF